MKIAATTLEQYRYWRETEFFTAEQEYKSLQELIAKIRGERTPMSIPAMRGVALANILEKPGQYHVPEQGVYRCEGFDFDETTLTQFRLTLPDDAFHEIWLPRYYYNGNYLVARADLWLGAVVGDTKCITKAFTGKKYEDYENSMQWRVSLLMADCPEFRYYVAHGKERKKDDVIELVTFHTFKHYRSKDTDDRVHRLMNEFAEFAKPYLEDAA